MKKFFQDILKSIKNKEVEIVRLEPKEVYKKMDGDSEGILLDVRETDEFKEGHAKGAINIPLKELESASLDDTKLYYCICRTGARSKRAYEILKQKGFKVVKVTGGTLAWSKEGLPMQKNKKTV